MARLGKRERADKRNLIRSNLANLSQMERSSGTMHSALTGVHKGTQYSRLEANAHTLGCHVGASEGRASGTVNVGGKLRPNKPAPPLGAPRSNARMADGTECHVTRKV